MLEIKQEENRLIMDARESIRKGEHPRTEIINAIKQAPKGTIVEIHLPHRAQPLVSSIESMGMSCIINELDPHHFRLVSVKMD